MSDKSRALQRFIASLAWGLLAIGLLDAEPLNPGVEMLAMGTMVAGLVYFTLYAVSPTQWQPLPEPPK